MKRIILFLLLQFAVLIAIGSAKTTWGFQPFSIPGDSIIVPAGGDIQAAINSLPNGGGSGSWGPASDGHYHVKNVIIKDNVIFDSNRGICFSDPGG
ncbi:hypothetical protein D1164_22970, partial [Mariniphaga sediminis]